MSNNFSRRRVIGSGLAFSLAGLAKPVRANSLPTNPDVVIIGAGFAGIAAARTLIAAGKSCVVIEATQGPGGRCVADHSLGLPVDLGASWLHAAKFNPLTKVAHQFGLRTVRDVQTRDYSVFRDRTLATQKEYNAINNKVAAIDARASNVPIDHDRPMSELTGPISSWTDHVAEAYIGQLDSAVELSDLSAVDYDSIISNGTQLFVAPAFGLLPPLLAATLPVRYGVMATAVDTSGTGVQVTTTAGTLSAKAVVVTVAVGALLAGNISFLPQLPQSHLGAIAGLEMGLLNKVVLKFNPGALPVNSQSGFDQYRPQDGRISDAVLRLDGQPIAICFAGGAEARDLEAAGKAAAIDFHLTALSECYGSSIRKNMIGAVVTEWNKNPLTFGSYSSSHIGHHAARAQLAIAVADRLWFAGEALGGQFASETAGAWISGMNAAKLIVKKLG